MIWLTWRQLRAQLLVVYALVAAACVTLALTGPALARLAHSDVNVYDALSSSDRLLFHAGIAVVAAAPALLGVFWGAPLVARELETGTYRLVWTQSVPRSRWLAVRLGFAAGSTAVAVGILTFSVTWWARPIDGALGSRTGSLSSRLTPISFAMRGVVPIGYAVFALVLGTLMGLLLRRSVPAMALTLAVYVALQVAVPLWVRPHLVPPTTVSMVLSPRTFDGIGTAGSGPLVLTTHVDEPGAWIITNETVDGQGRAAVLPTWVGGCLGMGAGVDQGGEGAQAVSRPAGMRACFDRLTSEGYRQHVVYQPSSHFWPLQWAETGLYLVLSAVLTAVSFWWTRRRLG